MPPRVIELPFARLGVDAEQLIDPRHHTHGDDIAGVEFGRLEELPPRMRPAGGMHHLRTAHAIVGDIAVGLQNALKLSQEVLWPFASTPQAEVEHHSASRSAVL